MVGGTVMGFAGGLHYWWPKMSGRMYNETVARVAWFLVFVGFNITFISQFIMGSQGMPRRYWDYLERFHTMHGFSSIGAFILGTGFAIMLFNLFYAWFKGEKAPRNPWGSAGFEWMTTTPPHPHNFAEDPVIRRGPYDYHLATEEELAST
jgi:cytochrome c oxidase subunit 1